MVRAWRKTDDERRKTDVIACAKGFIEDLGDATINLALIGVLCIFGIQYIFGKRWFSSSMFSMPNFNLRSLMLLLIISSLEKSVTMRYVLFKLLLFSRPSSLTIIDA